MRSFSRSVDIDASPAQVWNVMSDVEHWHEWTTSIRQVERLDEGAMGVGRKVRVRQPRLAPADFVVTAWHPSRGFDWVTKHPGVTAVARHTIEPTVTGSRVTLSVTFSGLLSGVVAWMYGGLTEKYLQMEADGLKCRVEETEARDRMAQ